jgi:hypothetical protein
MQIIDNFRIAKSHWYGFLPRRLQYYLVKAGIKLGFIHRYGLLTVTIKNPDGKTKKVQGYNILTDIGLKHLSDVLGGIDTTNTSVGFMEAGSGTTTPVIGDSDTETPLTTADRLAVTLATRSTTTPFELVFETFINSTKYTRPQTINELVLFFTPDETGDIFARGVLAAGIALGAGATATLTYAIVWR